MTPDDLDRCLSEDTTIEPSARFAASVMARLKQDVSAPRPMPFPWRWAIPGMAAAVLVLAAPFVGLVPEFSSAVATSLALGGPQPQDPIVAAVTRAETPWFVLALMASVVPTLAAARLSAPRL